MCAFTRNPETSQFIDPPPGSVIGEKITFEGYEGQYLSNICILFLPLWSEYSSYVV